MAANRDREDDGVPPSDESAPDRPSDDEEIILADERPAMSHDRVTATEQVEGESLNTRLAREQPEADAEEYDELEEERRRTAGRLVEPTVDGRDVTREMQAEESEDESGLSAEETAVTVREADEVMPDEPSTDEAAGRGADHGA